MNAFLRELRAAADNVRHLWVFRNCRHPAARRISGDERRYGYGYRCTTCEKLINIDDPSNAPDTD